MLADASVVRARRSRVAARAPTPACTYLALERDDAGVRRASSEVDESCPLRASLRGDCSIADEQRMQQQEQHTSSGLPRIATDSGALPARIRAGPCRMRAASRSVS